MTQNPQGPAGDGTKGVLAAPTVADQLAAEKAARDRQDSMGWEPAPPRDGDTVPKGLSKGQARDLARRIRSKLSRKG